jgi:hypothetical protein
MSGHGVFKLPGHARPMTGGGRETHLPEPGSYTVQLCRGIGASAYPVHIQCIYRVIGFGNAEEVVAMSDYSGPELGGCDGKNAAT